MGNKCCKCRSSVYSSTAGTVRSFSSSANSSAVRWVTQKTPGTFRWGRSQGGCLRGGTRIPSSRPTKLFSLDGLEGKISGDFLCVYLIFNKSTTTKLYIPFEAFPFDGQIANAERRTHGGAVTAPLCRLPTSLTSSFSQLDFQGVTKKINCVSPLGRNSSFQSKQTVVGRYERGSSAIDGRPSLNLINPLWQIERLNQQKLFATSVKFR